MTDRLTLHLDDRQSAWLRESGNPVATVQALLGRAIRDDALRCALRDERAIALSIRRRHTQLMLEARHRGDASEERARLRAAAEDELFASLKTTHDPVLRAAAARLRLHIEIERGEVKDAAAARAALQRLREQRPGCWHELPTHRRAGRRPEAL